MKSVNPADYYHPKDKQTLDNLQRIPGFTPALKAFMKIFDEKMIHGLDMANKIRLGPGQLEEIYRLLPPICEILGIEEPELYLEMNPIPNAYTVGDTRIAVSITSGLVETMQEPELRAVLVHECGHIACRHCLYHSMASYILKTGGDFLGLGALTYPLRLAFFQWQRCSELTCDRAAAICMRGAEPVMKTMVRLAGGKASITDRVNLQLYMTQAADYEALMSSSTWEKALQFLALAENSHPFLSVRASEVSQWCQSEAFQQILAYMDGADNDRTCGKCGAKISPSWKYCRQCGGALR